MLSTTIETVRTPFDDLPFCKIGLKRKKIERLLEKKQMKVNEKISLKN